MSLSITTPVSPAFKTSSPWRSGSIRTTSMKAGSSISMFIISFQPLLSFSERSTRARSLGSSVPDLCCDEILKSLKWNPSSCQSKYVILRNGGGLSVTRYKLTFRNFVSIVFTSPKINPDKQKLSITNVVSVLRISFLISLESVILKNSLFWIGRIKVYRWTVEIITFK